MQQSFQYPPNGGYLFDILQIMICANLLEVSSNINQRSPKNDQKNNSTHRTAGGG